VRIAVNGEEREVPEGTTVAELVRRLGLADAPVAVERNQSVVRRAERETTVLRDGDRLELVTLVGGG
jgi:sulfur carrier protein